MKKESFGKKLERLRREGGFKTATDLGCYLGVRGETVRNWERGKNVPGVYHMLSLTTRFPSLLFTPSEKPVAKHHAKKLLLNRVAIVLDCSGSMRSVAEATRLAFNRTLADLRENSKKTGQMTHVFVCKFGEILYPVTARLLEVLGDMTYFNPEDHSTKLFDAVNNSIETMQKVEDPAGYDVSYLVIVITDGADNASSDTYGTRMKQLLTEVHATDRWTTAWQVPPGTKRLLVSNFQIPAGNIVEWEGVAGIQRSSVLQTSGIGDYYASRSVGVNSSKSMYTTDASKLTTTQVKTALTDIQTLTRIWVVDRESEIREFVESRLGGPMLKGGAFYQLTKTEKKVQDYKRIIIMEKGSRAVYEGAEARRLLGLPTLGTVKIVPGNHANYDIFFQSTSTNRKLVRGTRVIYYPGAGVPFTEGPSARASR